MRKVRSACDHELRACVYLSPDIALSKCSPLSDVVVRLKHELDTVSGLQDDLETVETVIQATHSALTKTLSSKDSNRLLAVLKSPHSVLKEVEDEGQ